MLPQRYPSRAATLSKDLIKALSQAKTKTADTTQQSANSSANNLAASFEIFAGHTKKEVASNIEVVQKMIPTQDSAQ